MNTVSGAAALRVVAGVLQDRSGRVLITQRPPGKWQAGKWEFPGGKVAAGESEPQALGRELAEELGLQVLQSRPLLQLVHDYPEQRVQIAFWRIERYRGEARGLEGQALKWVAPAALRSEDLLPADQPLVEYLNSQSTTR